MDNLGDSELVRAYKSGDSLAFGALFDRYHDKLYRFIYYKTFSKETSEDIVSDVFHKAITRIDSYEEGKGTFSAWIYRIARNAVIDYYRTKKTTSPIEDAFDLATDDTTIETLDTARAFEHVRTHLSTLTPRQREIITLRIWEERPYREIAEIVGGTEDSVKMAFSRTMKELREKHGALGVLLLSIALMPVTLPFDRLS